jgi:predicted regulator of Ras-like GTPase activity (Roadblock/LC7/MglB family)
MRTAVMEASGDLPDLCERLRRDANARGVLVLDEAGEILGHSGAVGRLPEKALDAIADLVADVTASAAKNELADGDDLVAEIDDLQACAAPLGTRAILVVVFDDSSTLALVRLRMKRARDPILRTLEAR